MNRQITQLFGLVVVLFALLILFTSRWSVFEAEGLEDNPANRRPLLEEQRIPRGLIQGRDATTLANSRATGPRSTRQYERNYPTGELFSHAVGYSYVSNGRAGLEQSQNDVLTGRGSEFGEILDQLGGGSEEGDDVRTTLDPDAQRVALEGLGGRRGAVVALDARSGRVRVMASVPTFDPNLVPERFAELNRAPGSPLLNRTTQGRYPPGSTMKVVTAAAALDSGRFRPDSTVDGSSPREIGGAPLNNFGNQDYGPVTLTEALTNSVNTAWATVGERLGPETMYEYMGRFGFGEVPPMDYPRQQMAPSGVYKGGRLIDPEEGVDIGRVAIGQERLQVTPLQMAVVAATVANDGVRMEPRLVERIVSPEGRVVERIEPAEAERVMSEESARALQGMMGRVVEEGSGTAAALEGVQVAGKTGTAEVDGGSSNQAWFIAFAPVRNARVAVAVTVERTQGFGGTVAAPIARSVLQELLTPAEG